MKNKKQIVIIFLTVLALMGCTCKKTDTNKLRVVVSNWVGYSPLIYAYEKGDLDELNMELIVSTSLQASLLMYKKNRYEGICSTQKELNYLNQNKEKSSHLIPVAVFNRSYGGDVILSNIPKKQLYGKAYKKADVFLEKESISEVLFNDFKKMTRWDTSFNIHYINQYNVTDLNYDIDKNIPKLVVTYEPYATKLRKKGLYLIESTKNDHLLVFDFLSIKRGSLSEEQIKKLQKTINRSIMKLKNNPEEFFDTVKVYFEDVTFDEFKSSLNEIQLFSEQRKNKFLSLIQNGKALDKTDYIKEQ